jgi:RNA polymerase sigma-70 factor (ECF subfamily)
MSVQARFHEEQVVTQQIPSARTRLVSRDAGHAPEAEDESAFSLFFRSHFEGVTRTVYLIVHDRARAEDIAQDAFLQLFRDWPRISGYERPEAWVRRVAIRLAVRGLKRDELWRSVRRLFVPHERTSGADIDVAEAITRLPRGQRAAIVLYYYEDRPTAEIASLLGCSEATVRVHLHRGRQRLARLLGEEEPHAAR